MGQKKSKLLLNINDFAAEMGYTRQTVRNWLNAGTCPVPPIEGTKPAKWLPSAVQAFKAGGDA